MDIWMWEKGEETIKGINGHIAVLDFNNSEVDAFPLTEYHVNTKYIRTSGVIKTQKLLI